jgi:hypothetical protein
MFCRDCGGPTTRIDRTATCDNTTTRGQQQDPKDVCRNLTMHDRQFCEHCGQAVVGLQRCPRCQNPPTSP